MGSIGNCGHTDKLLFVVCKVVFIVLKVPLLRNRGAPCILLSIVNIVIRAVMVVTTCDLIVIGGCRRGWVASDLEKGGV